MQMPDIDSLARDAIRAVLAQAQAKGTAAASEKDIEQRMNIAKEGLALFSVWAKETQAPEPKAALVLRQRLEKDEQTWPKEQERRRRAAEIAAQRQAEQERRAEAARQRAQAREEARAHQDERRRAMSPLLCADGTPSPSCTCGGSWRGCCSWHGGVSGCSR